MALSDRDVTPTPPKAETLGKIAALLERNGIEVDDIGRVQKVNLWQGFMKGDDGEPVVVDLAGVTLSPAWEDGPQWPVVQPARPITAKPRPAPKPTTGEQTIVVCPDPQIGCRRYEDGTLSWFQDDRAIDVSLQIIRDAKPTRIVNIGDTCDFPEWSSKFLVSPEFVLTTQPTLDRAHRYLAEQLTEAPEDCESDLFEGNHDNRLALWITRNAMAALRLRKANAPESWPVLSMQYLLRLDELGVRYVDGYPAASTRLAPGAGPITPLIARHGERLTVSAVAKNERQSSVQGHIHRIQDHYETFEVDGEPVIVNVWSTGCLSRIDGAVPSVKGGSDARGVEVRRMENWQQGVGVVTVAADGSWSKEIVHIQNGRATWRGKEYRA